MQIFELHFNPKLKKERVFDSFVYEPQNIYERKLGSLYIVGELQNTLPQSSNLLNDLAKIIKGKYYTLPLKTPKGALSEALKRANEFLSEEVKKDNVSWLGNLNFSVLSLEKQSPQTGIVPLTFTKTGSLKILLLRDGQIIDIAKNLDFQEINPYPLKVFFNTVSGKLAQNDILLVLTKEIFEFFHQQNILSKIAQTEILDEKKLKEILPFSLFTKGEGAKISGICFLTLIKKEISPAKEPKEILFQKKREPLLQIPSIFLKPFQKIHPVKLLHTDFVGFNRVKLLTQRIRHISFKKLPCFWSKKTQKPLKILTKINPVKFALQLFNRVNLKLNIASSRIKSLPQPILQKINLAKQLKRKIVLSKTSNIRKNLIIILLLILFLFSGFLIFKKREEEKGIEIKSSLNKIQEKINEAENFLIFENEARANSLFKEAWVEILPLTEKKGSLKAETLSLKQSIEENLKNLNKLEKIEEPEQASEFEYKKGADSLIPPENLIPPSEADFNFDLFAYYFSNLYFLDRKTCKIIKYPYLGASNWSPPQTWKEPDAHCSEPKSMAINGSIWVLNKNNSIIRYYKGVYQETINLNFFPFPEDITKIKTKPELAELYLLEPLKKRLIIISEEGDIVQQFQSEKFDDLKDFTISENGKTIYLLNGTKVYQITL